MIWFVLHAVLGVCVADERTEFSADRIVIDEETLTASGDVVLNGGGSTLHANTLLLRRDSEGNILFTGSDLLWTPCTCETPPWAIWAANGEGEADKEVVLKKAAVEVCGRRVLPIPWARIPLNKRTPRALFPEFGQGAYGPRMAAPVWFPIGESSELIVTPEFRFAQAFRPRLAFEGPTGQATIAVANEFESEDVRWDASAVNGIDDGRFRLAVASQWGSDTRVFEDYGTEFYTRNTPFAEQLMVAATGPFRLESNTFDRGPMQRPIGAVLSVAGENIGPVAIDAATRVDWIELGDEPVDVQRSFSHVAIRSGKAIGVSEAHIRGDVRALQWSDGGPWAQARVQGGWFLPFWGQLGDWTHIAEAGVEGGLARQDGAMEDRFAWEKEEARWSYGPTLRSTFVGPQGVPLSSIVRLKRSLSGWEPSFSAQLNQQNLSGWVQAERDLQGGRVGYADEVFGAGLGLVHGAGLIQSVGNTRLTVLNRWSSGVFGVYDHGTLEWVRYGPTLQWDSGCNCLAVDLGVEWARDRDYPEAWLRLDLRSARLKDSP